MPVSDRRAAPGGRAAAIALRVLLGIAIVVPLGTHLRGDLAVTNEGLARIARERHGVAYLVALAPFTEALLDAQARAVAGQNVQFAALTAATDAVQAVDHRWGEELRSSQRWSTLRAELDSVRGGSFATPLAAFLAYQQVTGPLVQFYRHLRNEAGLETDPDLDTHYLSEAAAIELPAGLVAGGEYAHRLALAKLTPDEDRPEALGAVQVAGETLEIQGDELSDDLELAIASTARQTLGPAVIGKLDEYRNAVDVLLTDSGPPGQEVARASANRAGVLVAGLALQATVLSALDGLLATRAAQLSQDRRWTAGLLLLAMVGAVALAVPVRWRRRPPEQPFDQPPGEALGNGGEEADWGVRSSPTGPRPAWRREEQRVAR